MSRLLHLTASGQPVGTAQQWRGTTFNRSFSGLIGGTQMSQSVILMATHFISQVCSLLSVSRVLCNCKAARADIVRYDQLA